MFPLGSVRVLFSTGRPKRGKFVDTCSNRVVPNSYFYKICLGPVGRKFVCLRFWARKQSIQCRRSFCLWKQANTGVHPLLLKEARCICLFNQQTKWFTVTSKINRDWLVHISWLLASRCNGRLIEVWVHSSLSFIAGLPDWHAWNCCNHSIWKSNLGPAASGPPGKSDNGSTSSALKMFSRDCWSLHKLTFESYSWSS